MKQSLLVFILIFSLKGSAQLVYNNYLDGHVYIKFSREAASSFLREPVRAVKLTSVRGLAPLAEKYEIKGIRRPYFAASDDETLPYILRLQFGEKTLVDDLITALEKLPGVEYAEKVPLAETHATPNDYSISSASVHLNQINAQNAWNVFNGNSNITVAIVDNAVMWSHVDLIANTYTNTGEIAGNNIDDDGNGYVDDVNGFDVADWDNNAQPTNVLMSHGTMCAGIAGARTDNNTGVASIGWNIKIIPVKCEPDNSSSNTTVSYGYEGIVYAARAKARVISCSWGSSATSLTEQSVVNYAWNRGSIVIASAGNNGNSAPNYPAAYNNVYSVAAVHPNDVKIGFSTYGTWVDISAPGWDIYTTVPYSSIPSYGQGSGTSMAAPMVAGLAGLMLSKSPAMTRQDVLNCISNTAVNIGTITANSSYSTQLGAGRIEAFAAMTCAASFSAAPPVANFTAFLQNTCPSTPVQFTDSSLYLPTAWSWTFQGGSPATSTLQNPVVQWNNTGTYSVALSVSNNNGSNTKIKNSFIVVSSPGSLPFYEGFEQTAFLPAGWSAKNIMNDSMYWQRTTTAGGFGTSTASAVFNNYVHSVEGERDEMLTPKFSFTNVAQAKLVFDVAYARYDQDYSDTLEIKLSTNCGASWTSIYLKGGSNLATASDHNVLFVPTSTEWRKDSVDISTLTAGQGNVMFSFINRGHFGQPIYLDNINLYFPTPTLSINHQTAVCDGSAVNFTTQATAASSFTFLPGGPGSGSVAAFIYNSPGQYTASLSAENGTATSTYTSVVNVLAFPTVAVNSTSLCSGETATLTASGANSYSWTNNDITPTTTVSPLVTTVYTVTGTNGGLCSSVAESTVIVFTTPTVNVNNSTICPGGTATIVASGAAGYLWSDNSNSPTLIVKPSVTTVYTVTGSTAGCSNTKTVSVIIGPPVALATSASSTAICAGEQATLSVTGASSYTWHGGPANSNYVISPSASANYSVTGVSGDCEAAGSISITVNPLPVAVISVSNALCGEPCSGIIDVQPSGGTGPYQHLLYGGFCFDFPCKQLCAGSYTVLTSDSKNCVTLNSVVVTSVAPLSFTTNSSPVNCAGCNNGSVQVTVSGGEPPYYYAWSNGTYSAGMGNLSAGCYTVLINDAGSCSAETVVCVSDITPVKEHLFPQVRIYPNPAQAVFYVDVSAIGSELFIYNALSQLVHHGTLTEMHNTIPTRGLAPGIYQVLVKSGNTLIHNKLLLE